MAFVFCLLPNARITGPSAIVEMIVAAEGAQRLSTTIISTIDVGSGASTCWADAVTLEYWSF